MLKLIIRDERMFNPFKKNWKFFALSGVQFFRREWR